jgi:hypothetical protein
MAIQGDRAVADHLIQAHFGTSFTHAYVIPSEGHIALRTNEGVVLKYFAGAGPAGRGRIIDQLVAPEHEHLGTHAVTTWPDTTPMQFRTIDGLSVRFAESAPGSPGVRTIGGLANLPGIGVRQSLGFLENHDYGPQSAARASALPRLGPEVRTGARRSRTHSLTRWPASIFSSVRSLPGSSGAAAAAALPCSPPVALARTAVTGGASTPTPGNGTRCLRSGLVVSANASGLTAAWSGRSMALYRRVRTGHAIGGGSPCTLAASAGSQPQTAHACRTDDRPNSSAARCGSALARASSQSSTNSPSPASQRAAAGDNDAAANPAGAG